MAEFRIRKREGHYTIKIVESLPKRGNSNWLYAIRNINGPTTIDILYEWNPFKKVFEDINIGGSTSGSGNSNIQEGDNVSITGTGTSTDPLILNVVPEYNLTEKITIDPATATQSITYTRANNADNSLPANRDIIVPGYIEITRDSGGGSIFNIASESGWNPPTSPQNTLWQHANLNTFDTDISSFSDLETALFNIPGAGGFADIPGETFVVLVQNDGGTNLTEDQVFEVTFNTWASGGAGGGLEYTRTPLVSLSSSVSSIGYIVKTFDDTGVEIVTDRKFYQNDVEIVEPTNWSLFEVDLSLYALISSLSTVAFDNNYNSLDNLPVSGNPTGLEAIDEGNGIGWRLVGKDTSRYGNIGEDAIDLSHTNGTSITTAGASGKWSVAIGGVNNRAVNSQDIVVGGANNIVQGGGGSGIYGGQNNSINANGCAIIGSNGSTANNQSAGVFVGGQNDANEFYSIILGGFRNTANGEHSTVINSRDNTAHSWSETVIGPYTTDYVAQDIDSWSALDRVFTVGNGSLDTNRSDAFTVLKNGDIAVGINNFEANTTGERLQVNGKVKASSLNLTNLPIHANEAAAVTAGLITGDVYMTATGELRIKL